MSSAPSTTSNKIGKFKLTPQTFAFGEAPWQKAVSIKERKYFVNKLISVFIPFAEHLITHHRKKELEWFARKTEGILYLQSESYQLYATGVDVLVSHMEAHMTRDPALAMIRHRQDIPSTERLEELFTVRCERSEYVETDSDEQLMAEGAKEVPMDIGEIKFFQIDIPIETPEAAVTVSPLPKDEKKKGKNSLKSGKFEDSESPQMTVKFGKPINAIEISC